VKTWANEATPRKRRGFVFLPNSREGGTTMNIKSAIVALFVGMAAAFAQTDASAQTFSFENLEIAGYPILAAIPASEVCTAPRRQGSGF
jgi:hypothetical protein